MALLELNGIRKGYSSPEGEAQTVLDVPSFSLEAGAELAIAGTSGCGKTTLLRLAAGILVPASGTVALDDRDLGGLSEAERRGIRSRTIGTVFQDFRLLDHLDVIENVVLPFRLGAGRLDRTVRARAEQLLERMGIERLRRRSVPRLSQGERQRVAICRALVTEPGLVLADEPTGNLDPANKRVILDALLDAARDRNAAVLTVTHDHDLLDAFDRVVDLGRDIAPVVGGPAEAAEGGSA